MKWTLILAMLACAPCQAKRGETVPQIEARYGNPLTVLPGPPLPTRTYRFEGFEIVVSFLDGVAVSEDMRPEARDRKLSNEMCLGLAAALTGKTNWLQKEAQPPANISWNIGGDFRARKTELGAYDEFSVDNKAYLDEIAKQTRARDQALVAAFGAEVSTNRAKGDAASTNLLSPKEAERQRAKQGVDANVLKFHQDLADRNDPYGQYKMGMRYLKGDGVDKDEPRG